MAVDSQAVHAYTAPVQTPSRLGNLLCEAPRNGTAMPMRFYESTGKGSASKTKRSKSL